MEQQAIRIFGLDTSFARDEEVQMAETATVRRDPPGLRIALETTGQASMEERKTTVRLADLLPLLMEASKKNRAWIKDFYEDEITVSQDLYEVALAYRAMGRAA